MEKSITYYIKLSIHFPYMCWPKGSTQSSIIDSNLIFATPLGCLHSTYLWKVGTVDKESTCQCRRHKRCGFDPWVRKSPLRRKWQPTPVFLPGKFHRQKSLVDGVEKSQTWLSVNMHTYTHTLGMKLEKVKWSSIAEAAESINEHYFHIHK